MRDTFHCPRWEDGTCGCPDGTVAHKCPAFQKDVDDVVMRLRPIHEPDMSVSKADIVSFFAMLLFLGVAFWWLPACTSDNSGMSNAEGLSIAQIIAEDGR